MTATGNITTTGDVTAAHFIGNGSQLTGITATNVNGNVNGDTVQANNFAFTPSTVNISAGTGVIVTNAIMRVQGNGGPVDITATPYQISLGSNDGQFLIIRGLSNTNTVKFDDGDGLILDAGVSFVMGEGDILTLIYDDVGKVWIEISRSDR